MTCCLRFLAALHLRCSPVSFSSMFGIHMVGADWHVICGCACRKELADWEQAAVLDTGNHAITSLDWALGRYGPQLLQFA